MSQHIDSPDRITQAEALIFRVEEGWDLQGNQKRFMRRMLMALQNRSDLDQTLFSLRAYMKSVGWAFPGNPKGDRDRMRNGMHAARKSMQRINAERKMERKGQTY